MTRGVARVECYIYIVLHVFVGVACIFIHVIECKYCYTLDVSSYCNHHSVR